MKKITSFIALIITFSFGLNAQTISFEESEGYTLGDINGQSNWETTGDDNGGFIMNQVVTDEAASDGTYSLKLTKEPDFPGQPQPLVGAFYNYPVPISNDAAAFSADIYLSEQGTTSFRSLMGLVDLQNETYRTYIDFFYDGTINVFVKGGPTGIQLVYTGSNWEVGTWFNIKIETTGQTVKFYKDNIEIYEGLLISDGPIEQVRFVHDNYDGYGYIDNFITNGEALSIENPTSEAAFTHFYNKNTKTLVLKSSNETFNNISIFNVLGQNVTSKELSQNTESVDMAGLPNGVYIIKIKVGNATKAFRVLKQ